MHTFELPSGIEIEVQEMTGAEEELLTNQRLIRSGDAINQVLRNCLVRIGEKAEPKEVAKYLKSLYHAVNVVAELHGPPLPERRLLLLFPSLAEQAGRPGMSVGLLGLLGANGLDASTLEGWFPEWEASFKAAFETGKADARIHTARLNYYKKCFEAMLGGDNPTVILWPLLSTPAFTSPAAPSTAAA